MAKVKWDGAVTKQGRKGTLKLDEVGPMERFGWKAGCRVSGHLAWLSIWRAKPAVPIFLIKGSEVIDRGPGHQEPGPEGHVAVGWLLHTRKRTYWILRKQTNKQTARQ